MLNHSKVWTNQILKKVVDEGLVVYREGAKGRIYKLSKKGCELVDCKYLWGWGNLEHTLLRNETLIKKYKNETLSEKVFIEYEIEGTGLVPDASIDYTNSYVFIEIDRWQKWKANKQKLEKYAALKNAGIKFTLIWVVEMESRIDKLKKACKEHGLTHEIYNKEEISTF